MTLYVQWVHPKDAVIEGLMLLAFSIRAVTQLPWSCIITEILVKMSSDLSQDS